MTAVDEPTAGPRRVITERQNLGDIISFARFRFNSSTSSVLRQEKEILEPQLVALGYSNISWETIEEDSFGPLWRLCKATNKNGEEVTFAYG